MTQRWDLRRGCQRPSSKATYTNNVVGDKLSLCRVLSDHLIHPQGSVSHHPIALHYLQTRITALSLGATSWRSTLVVDVAEDPWSLTEVNHSLEGEERLRLCFRCICKGVLHILCENDPTVAGEPSVIGPCAHESDVAILDFSTDASVIQISSSMLLFWEHFIRTLFAFPTVGMGQPSRPIRVV